MFQFSFQSDTVAMAKRSDDPVDAIPLGEIVGWKLLMFTTHSLALVQLTNVVPNNFIGQMAQDELVSRGFYN